MKRMVVALPVVLLVLFGLHELSVRHFQEVTCAMCHEMKDPVRKWRDSGTAKNHNNCAGCHFDTGLRGKVDMTKAAAKEFVAHFQRDPEAPIKPAPEPLFLDVEKQPAYWSMVPNSRCYQCKDAKNHKEADQMEIHRALLKNIANQPCKDCHSHEMRKGQKFYQKLLPTQGQEGIAQAAVPTTAAQQHVASANDNP